MPKFEIIGQSAQDTGNAQANTSRLINCYRVPVVGNGKTRYVLRDGPVTERVVTGLTEPVYAIGLGREATVFFVDSNNVKFLDPDYTVNTIASPTVNGGSGARISANLTDTTITTEGNYYVVDNSNNITQPAGKAFTTVTDHFYIAGYTVLLESLGPRFQWTAVGDATSLNAGHVANVDMIDDNLLRGFEISGNAVLMGQRSTELWRLTTLGNEDAFERVTTWNRGLFNAQLVCQVEDDLFWVANDGNVYFGLGKNSIDITLPALREAIKDAATGDSEAIYFEHRGHKMCMVTFSTRPAFVFNATMGEWFEMSDNPDLEASVGWNFAVQNGRETLVTVPTDGIHAIRSTSEAPFSNPSSSPLERCVVSAPIWEGRKDITLDYIEFVAETGASANLNLQISRNGGKTFTAKKPKTMGTSKKTTWRNQGQANQSSLKLTYDTENEVELNTTAIFEVSEGD